MTRARFISEENPVFQQEVLPVALRALYRGEAMGFKVDRREPVSEQHFELFIEELGKEGIANTYVTFLSDVMAGRETDSSSAREAFQRIYDILEHNPAPKREWQSLLGFFGAEQLARLLGVSETSVHRYSRGERQAPPEVISRLHWLAIVIGHLSGSYNEFGVRRWFQRPRAQLDGKSPQQVLLAEGDWSPDGEAAALVEELAKGSLGMIAT